MGSAGLGCTGKTEGRGGPRSELRSGRFQQPRYQAVENLLDILRTLDLV